MAANESAAELALGAKALGALLDLSDALNASDDNQAAIVQHLCCGIAPHHPGSLIFIAEETNESALPASHAEGMGAALIRDVRLE